MILNEDPSSFKAKLQEQVPLIMGITHAKNVEFSGEENKSSSIEEQDGKWVVYCNIDADL